MSVVDEIYYEQNPESLEQGWRDFLVEYGLTEDEYPFRDYCNEL